jgi:hypothetical protein
MQLGRADSSRLWPTILDKVARWTVRGAGVSPAIEGNAGETPAPRAGSG